VNGPNAVPVAAEALCTTTNCQNKGRITEITNTSITELLEYLRPNTSKGLAGCRSDSDIPNPDADGEMSPADGVTTPKSATCNKTTKNEIISNHFLQNLASAHRVSILPPKSGFSVAEKGDRSLPSGGIDRRRATYRRVVCDENALRRRHCHESLD